MGRGPGRETAEVAEGSEDPGVREAFAELFSTMFYMERLGLRLATAYEASAEDPSELEFARLQKQQEGRHVALCRGLATRYGQLRPQSTWTRMMDSTLLGCPIRAIQLVGLLGGDIMGDFLLQRLKTTSLPSPTIERLDEVLEDEQAHIAHFLLHLPEALDGLGWRDRLRCLRVQLVLLFADVMETRRLRPFLERLGFDPGVESVLGYLYYREKMEPLIGRPGILMVPRWLMKLVSGSRYARAEASLRELA